VGTGRPPARLRYYANGTLDPSFGGDGIQTTGLGHDERAAAVALQADGKIIVVGTRWEDDDSCFACKDRDLALARYNANGTLDASFDGDGKLTDGLGGDEGLEVGREDSFWQDRHRANWPSPGSPRPERTTSPSPVTG
jgi:uncharacterized delta-60 repeat protein